MMFPTTRYLPGTLTHASEDKLLWQLFQSGAFSITLWTTSPGRLRSPTTRHIFVRGQRAIKGTSNVLGEIVMSALFTCAWNGPQSLCAARLQWDVHEAKIVQGSIQAHIGHSTEEPRLKL